MPNWPVTLIKRRFARRPAPDKRRKRAFLLIAEERSAEFVAACCENAAARGVRPGFSIEHTRALLPTMEIVVDRWNTARDADALLALARWALRFTPAVSPDYPDGLLLDIAGCEHLFGGEDGLLAQLAGDLRRLGFPARIAAAPTSGCAAATARGAAVPLSQIPPGREREALIPLPIAALRIDAQTVTALAEVNLHTIGELLLLPRNDLAARFGPALSFALDAALGNVLEHHAPVLPATPLREAREFDGAVTDFEPVAHTVRELLTTLLERVCPAGCGLRGVEVEVRGVDRVCTRVPLTLTYPTQDVDHIWSLIGPKLEKVKVGFGVERVAVRATHVDPLPSTQAAFWRDAGGTQPRQERQLGELLDRLADRLGPDAAFAVELRESYVPERAFAPRPVLHAQDVLPERRHDANRPSRLFERPEPARVMALVPDGPPIRVEWRGESAHIQAARGPERLAAPWWEPAPLPPRDYFEVQLESGRVLWMYREPESGRWFVQGEWA